MCCTLPKRCSSGLREPHVQDLLCRTTARTVVTLWHTSAAGSRRRLALAALRRRPLAAAGKRSPCPYRRMMSCTMGSLLKGPLDTEEQGPRRAEEIAETRL